MNLAPAAGAGIGKKLADALLEDPGFLRSLRDAFLEALRADNRFWDKATKSWDVVPDYKTRLSAACALLANMEGEPIKRVIHQHLNGPDGPKPFEAMQNSPALLAAVEREVEKAKFRDRNKRPVREVSVLEVD